MIMFKHKIKLSKCHIFSVIFIICYFVQNVNASSESVKNCEELYKNGVNSYLDEHWADCIDFLERAVQLYNTYIKQLINCRLKCHKEVLDSNPIIPANIDNLPFYESAIKNTLCVLKCKNNNKELFKNYTLTKETETLFESRKPYEYLHICYFQKNKIQEAASSAFTYLVTNPGDEVMLKNLRYYSTLPEVDMNEVMNFEAKEYVYLYIHGTSMYDHKDWKSVIYYIEESLIAFLQSEDECRAQCEGPFDQGWYPDFTASVANHFTYCLKCKRRCPHKLNTLNGEIHDDLLPSHYHFLQFSYHKMGNLKMACEAVASYLLFYPDDETMQSNKLYYLKFPKVHDEYFTPRQEAIDYVKRQNNELKLLNFINKEFNQIGDEEDHLKENEISQEFTS